MVGSDSIVISLLTPPKMLSCSSIATRVVSMFMGHSYVATVMKIFLHVHHCVYIHGLHKLFGVYSE